MLAMPDSTFALCRSPSVAEEGRPSASLQPSNAPSDTIELQSQLAHTQEKAARLESMLMDREREIAKLQLLQKRE